MKRTRTGGYGIFLARHRRLLLFLGLLLAGTVGGVAVYRLSGQAVGVQLPVASAGAVFAEWLQSCTALWLLLGVLFLAGLAMWGFPVALAVPVFFGLGAGLAQAAFVALGGNGLAYAALAVLPGRLLAAAALLPACAESMRFSLQLGRQTLFRDARGGGLLREFRLYCLRFILFVGMAAAAGAADVLLRICFAGLLGAK